MSTADTVTTLSLGRGDSVACVSSVEPGTGHTRYKLRGTRVYGVVTVIPAYESDNVNPFTRRVRMQLGDCAKDHNAVRDHERDHLLRVNNVELCGAALVDITHVPTIDPHDINPYDVGIGYVFRSGGRQAPDATRSRAAALFAVIIDHWRSDPANQTVRLAAARYAVRTGDYLTRKAAAIRRARGRLAELRAELDGHTKDHKRMELLRDGTDPRPPDASPPDGDAAGAHLGTDPAA